MVRHATLEDIAVRVPTGHDHLTRFECTQARSLPVRAFGPWMLMQYVATLLALPLVGSACTWSQATPVTESGSQRANCADWNTYYFFRAAAPKDISTCLAAGADPNAETTTGWTPLHLAASAGKTSPCSRS